MKFAIYVWYEIPDIDVTWTPEVELTAEMMAAGDIPAEERADWRVGELASDLHARYSVPIIFPTGTRVLGSNHEMVLIALPPGSDG